MSEANAVRADAPPPHPDLAIRTRPPSPKRLSRKVLLGGAIALGATVAAALLFGLSAQPANRGREAEAIATAGGPPESIQSAPGQYASADLQGGDLDEAPLEEEPAESLAPPSDPAWSRQSGASAPSAPPAPSPQDIARTAPILFAAERATANAQPDDERLPSRLRPPRSRYEVMAGAVIPAALATELNSDLPGRVIAQVTAPVFDSVTGAHLLIPQGSRLIGTYDNGVRYGDRRILLSWNRLILPNGWSINLQGMQGSDPAGASGLSDRTDMHLDRLIGAIGMSAIVSVIANNAEDEDDDASLSQNIGDAAAQEAARTGGRIIDRELSVRPTLRVRAGAPVRVLVMRDIELRPYRGEGDAARP
jgi:type IV secretion system protein TrbI